MVPFAYAAAATPEAALARAAHGGDIDYIAGGTDMLQLLQEGVRLPRELIDINGLSLREIETSSSGVRIGALTHMADLADDARIRERFPVVSEALLASASPQVRNMATIGGNLLQRTRCLYFRDIATPCNKRIPGSGCPALDGQNRMTAVLGGSDQCIAAYPGDLAVALVALDAEVEVLGTRGTRTIPIEQLHRLPGSTPHIETVLEAGELITAVVIPETPAARRSHYLKVRDRTSFEFALASAAVALDLASGSVRQARVAVGGVATKPWRLRDIEEALTGRPLNQGTIAAAVEHLGGDARPRPGNAFKVELMRRTVERALQVAGGVA
jgi:xanthine dehydrogenase YagS FAD-binding subunit